MSVSGVRVWCVSWVMWCRMSVGYVGVVEGGESGWRWSGIWRCGGAIMIVRKTEK